jgi:hypothetical protein
VAALTKEPAVGEVIATVGTVLSTLIGELGPAAEAWFPAASTAVPAAIEIVTVPVPVQPVRVTRWTEEETVLTLGVGQLALEPLTVTWPGASVTVDAPVSNDSPGRDPSY